MFKWLLFIVLAVALTGGCGPRTYDDPLAAMMDRREMVNDRLRAARLAGEQHGDSPERIDLLSRLVWDAGHPAALRTYAIDELVRIDEADFRSKLIRRIALVQDWETLNHVLDLVVQRQWTEMTPTLVRSYARPSKVVQDADRPERQALEQLNPGKSVQQVVLEVFAGYDDSVSMRQQVAAWELLIRLSPWEQVIELLAKVPARTPMVIDLKAGAADLHVVPRNREGVLWLSHLRDPAQRWFYQAAKQAVAGLDSHRRQGLELRHLPVLLVADSDQLQQDRQTLYQQVQAYLGQQEHFTTGPRFDGPMHDYPQYLSRWQDRLTWADLLSIQVITRVLEDRQVVADLFAQADQDYQDKSTELGGVLRVEDGRLLAELHKPTIRHHDQKFIPTDRMIERMYTSLAHYHFHAQSYRNRSHAGPGRGDLDLAERLNFNGLVFTFVDRNRMNVDFYCWGGVVVDLGVIER